MLKGFGLEIRGQVKHLLENSRQVMPRALVGEEAVEKERRGRSGRDLRVELISYMCSNHESVFH